MTTPDRPAADRPESAPAGGGGPLSERGWRATVVGMHVVSAAVWSLAVVAAVLSVPRAGGEPPSSPL